MCRWSSALYNFKHSIAFWESQLLENWSHTKVNGTSVFCTCKYQGQHLVHCQWIATIYVTFIRIYFESISFGMYRLFRWIIAATLLLYRIQNPTTCTVLSNEVLNINLPILQQINITRKTVNYVLFMQSTNDSKRHWFNPGAIYFFMSALLRYRREWPNLLQQHGSIVSSKMLIHILFEKYKTGPTPFPVTWR